MRARCRRRIQSISFRPSSAPGAHCWKSWRAIRNHPPHRLVAEIVPQRGTRVFRLGQAAALQLWHHELDELANVVHSRIAAAEDETAIGARRKVHFFQLVDDALWRAGRDQDAIDQKAAA